MNDMKLNELIPIYNNNKSFYKKALYTIEKNNNCITLKLFSYNTLVCIVKISTINNYKIYKFSLNYEINKKYLFSVTTLKHIKEFLKQTIPQLKNVNITKKYLNSTLKKVITIK